MKKILREQTARFYSDQKWKDFKTDEDTFENLDIYPIRWAELGLSHVPKDGVILENGCGLGRVLKHYHMAKRKIIGMDYNERCLLTIRREHPDIPLIRADARFMPFKDNVFDSVMAYGLYHTIEENLDDAIEETSRIMKPGGVISATARIYNIQYFAFEIKQWLKKGFPKNPTFYKWAFKKHEWVELFSKHDFKTLSVHPAFSIHPFYRVPFLRDPKCFGMRLSRLRSYGYRYNKLGAFLHNCFHKLYDWLICCRVVFIGKVD